MARLYYSLILQGRKKLEDVPDEKMRASVEALLNGK